VFNADDSRVASRATHFAGRAVTFGLSATASVHAVDLEDRGVDGMRARIVTPSGSAPVESPLLGRGNLMNVLAATAVALDFGVALEDIVARTARLSPADRRGAVQRLRDGIVLIDDSYNSSPSALASALQVVVADRQSAGKVAVLGEMLELGDHSTVLHEQAGRTAAASGLRQLVAIGADGARAMAAAAHAADSDLSVEYFETSDRAAGTIASIVRPGDLVLVKGSRGIRTDRVADRIKAEFA
jgi:UDP-N-acetylmuramoyl-tripeptide--D-alanyl-D-alanine ligase